MKTKISKHVIFLGIFMVLLSSLASISTLRAYVVPAPSNYTGYVKGPGGVALKNAKVSLYVNGQYKRCDYTDSNGYYSITRLSMSGKFELKASKWRYFAIKITINSMGGTYNFKLASKSRKTWALIVDGQQCSDDDDLEVRFTNDAKGMYDTLIDHYSCNADRIYLLSDDDTLAGRDRETTKSNVKWAINEIAKEASSVDQVIIYWTGHGRVDILWTASFTISANDFDSYLDGINCDEMVIFLGPCRSGSFIDNLNDKQNRAIYTSCTASQSGYLYVPPLGLYPTHSLYPWAVYRGLDPDLDASTADTNNDGKVSLRELFIFCVDFVDDHTSSSQDPQYWTGNLVYHHIAYVGDQNY